MKPRLLLYRWKSDRGARVGFDLGLAEEDLSLEAIPEGLSLTDCEPDKASENSNDRDKHIRPYFWRQAEVSVGTPKDQSTADEPDDEPEQRPDDDGDHRLAIHDLRELL